MMRRRRVLRPLRPVRPVVVRPRVRRAGCLPGCLLPVVGGILILVAAAAALL